jgi:hypothetical protein
VVINNDRAAEDGQHSHIEGVPSVALVEIHDSGILIGMRIKEIILNFTLNRMVATTIYTMRRLM